MLEDTASVLEELSFARKQDTGAWAPRGVCPQAAWKAVVCCLLGQGGQLWVVGAWRPCAVPPDGAGMVGNAGVGLACPSSTAPCPPSQWRGSLWVQGRAVHLLGLGPRVGFEEPRMLLKDHLPAAPGSRGLRDSCHLCHVWCPAWGRGAPPLLASFPLPSSSTPGHKPFHLGGLLENTGTRCRKEGRASGLAGLALEPLPFL